MRPGLAYPTDEPKRKKRFRTGLMMLIWMKWWIQKVKKSVKQCV